MRNLLVFESKYVSRSDHLFYKDRVEEAEGTVRPICNAMMKVSKSTLEEVDKIENIDDLCANCKRMEVEE